MNPKKIVELWVEAFNCGNADALAEFYSDRLPGMPVPLNSNMMGLPFRKGRHRAQLHYRLSRREKT